MRSEAGPIRNISSTLAGASASVGALTHGGPNLKLSYIRGTISFWAGDLFPCGKDFDVWLSGLSKDSGR